MKIIESEMHFVPKTWGWERWIINNDLYCGKILCIEKDNFCSYHYHKIKDEVLYIQSGAIGMYYDLNGSEAKVWLDILYPGQAFHVTPGVIHQMYAIETTHIYEFSTHHEDSDSYRISRDPQMTKEELWELYNPKTNG